MQISFDFRGWLNVIYERKLKVKELNEKSKFTGPRLTIALNSRDIS